MSLILLSPKMSPDSALGKRKPEAQAGAQVGTQSAPPTIQRKLDVGPADDQYEREADELADSVMRSAGASKSSSSPSANAVQRAAIGLEGGALDGDMENRLRQSQSGGSSLPSRVRGAIEPKLGADLSGVKVHTDSAAVQLSQEMGAKAFTHQNHIYYGKGHSPNDLTLTAHEAVHTVQQGAVSQKSTQRKPSRADEGNVIQRLVDSEIVKMQQIQSGSRYFGKKDRKILKLLQAYNKHMRSGAAPTIENKQQIEAARELVGQLFWSKDKKKTKDVNWEQRQRLLQDVMLRLGKESAELDSYREIKEAKKFGTGNIATVWKTQFDDGFEAVFKEDEEAITNPASVAPISGISETDPNLGSRSIAMYRLDQLLGTGVIPRTERAIMSNRAGTAMELVKGKQLYSEKKSGGGTHGKFLDFDMSNSQFQSSMSNLQLLDMIAGQIDRHGGNVFVIQDENGNIVGVRGIDNDYSFGVAMDGNKKVMHDRGMPEYIDYQVAQNIMKITANDVRATLAGLLSVEEIEMTVVRFAKAKEFIEALLVFETKLKNGEETSPAPKGKLVRDWNEQTYEEQLTSGRQRVEDAYVGNDPSKDRSKAYGFQFTRQESGSYLHDRVLSVKNAKKAVESGEMKAIAKTDDTTTFIPL